MQVDTHINDLTIFEFICNRLNEKKNTIPSSILILRFEISRNYFQGGSLNEMKYFTQGNFLREKRVAVLSTEKRIFI